MPGRIPRSLTKKRNQFAYEGEQMRARLAAVVTELAALDYALTVIEPDYKPPKKATAPLRPALLPEGGIARARRQLLPTHPGIDTTSFAKLVAKALKIKLKTKEEQFRFASAVAMLLRRFEKRKSSCMSGNVVHQNKGVLSKTKRDGHFAWLTEDERARFVAAVNEAFNPTVVN
jgi:hypothetical protein